MTYEEALDILTHDPHVWRYHQLVAEDFHDPSVRDAWRIRVVHMASGTLPSEEDRKLQEHAAKHGGCC